MAISFDADGKPVITTAPVEEGHTDFAASVIGSESANFFRVRLEE